MIELIPIRLRRQPILPPLAIETNTGSLVILINRAACAEVFVDHRQSIRPVVYVSVFPFTVNEDPGLGSVPQVFEVRHVRPVDLNSPQPL